MFELNIEECSHC